MPAGTSTIWWFMEYKITVDLDNLIDEETLLKARRFLGNEVMRLADDYVPMDSGVLKDTAFVTPLADALIYPQPYAHYMYEGVLYVDPITKKGAFHDPVSGRFWSRPDTQKEKTDRPLNYAGAPKRGADWIERMWDEYGREIEEAVKNFVETEMNKK